MNLGYKLFLAATITASILVFNIDDTVKATASEGKGSSVKPKYVPLPNGPIGYDPETQTFYGQKLNEPDALGRFHLKLKYHLASQHPNVHAAEGLLGQRKVKIYCGNTNDFVDPSTQNQDNSILFYNNCIKTSFNTIEYKWVRDIVGCPLTYFPVHQGHFCYAVPKILNSFKINQKFEMDDSHTMLDVSLHQIIKDLVKELVMGVDYLAKIGFYSDFRDNNIKVARFKAFGRRNFVLAVRFVNPAALRLIKAYDDTYLIPAKQLLIKFYTKNTSNIKPTPSPMDIQRMVDSAFASMSQPALRTFLESRLAPSPPRGSSPLKRLAFPENQKKKLNNESNAATKQN